MDKIKLAQRTIALLSSMIESGECHTARTKEMKINALNGLEEVNNLLISGVSQQREPLKVYTKWLNDKIRDSDELDELIDDYFSSL